MATPRPSELRFAVLAADTVVLRWHEGKLAVLLIPAVHEHFKNKEALIGGLIKPTETAEAAARRHIEEKGGVEHCHLEQLYTFSSLERDPRGRVVSVAYLALLSPRQAILKERKRNPRWCPIGKVGALAFDHNDILNTALSRLRARLTYTTIVQFLLPPAFTLTELQQAYETILKTELDKRNFRKKILALGILSETGEKRTEGLTRPAALYKFTSKKLQTIEMV
jgi:8-oxo-dGTP diphosphatase